MIGEEDFVPEERNTKLTGVKPELVVRRPAGQGDSVSEEEKDSGDAARRFLDNGVGLRQLTQTVDCSGGLTAVGDLQLNQRLGARYMWGRRIR